MYWENTKATPILIRRYPFETTVVTKIGLSTCAVTGSGSPSVCGSKSVLPANDEAEPYKMDTGTNDLTIENAWITYDHLDHETNKTLEVTVNPQSGTGGPHMVYVKIIIERCAIDEGSITFE